MAYVDNKPHALVVPASGQGHANAFMLLARSLAALGVHVSFVYFSSDYANPRAKKRVVKAGSKHAEDGGTPSSAPAAPCGGDSGAGGRSNASSSSSDGGAPSKTYSNGSMGGLAAINTTNGLTTGSHGEIHEGAIRVHVVEDEITPGDMDMLFFVTPAMKENLYNLILELQHQTTPLTWLISDPFAPWTADVADRAGIPLVTFWTSTALSYMLTYDIRLLYIKGIFPEKGSPAEWKKNKPLMLDHVPGLPPFSSELYPKDVRFGNASSYIVSLLNDVFLCGKRAKRMIIHTMQELEPLAFQALQAVGIPAYAIGPLLHHATKHKSDSSATSDQLGCISWLDTQADASVLYVGFGSIVSFSAEEIHEVAIALEASGNPFLWVIREDSHGGVELSQVVPQGFLERIRGKGMIVGWAPQTEVLAHKAVGGFLTHCGWNSTLESLWEGVPMLCCPCFAEQMVNSHYICDVWEVGLELGRTHNGRRLERRNVEHGVKALMQKDEGLKVKRKALEMMQLARKTCQPGGNSFKNLHMFHEDVIAFCP